MAEGAAGRAEILEIGRPPRRQRTPRSRRTAAWAALAAGLMLLLVAGGLVVRQALTPPPPFTAGQLHDAYAGMVQRDGTSYLFPIDRANFGAPSVTVGPPGCRSLFRTTVAGRFPDAALDGVLAYWLRPDAGAIELFTVRYADAATAQAAYAQVSAAVRPCAGQPIVLSDRMHTGRVEPLDADPGSILATPRRWPRDQVRQSAYLLDLGDHGRFAISATQLRNTVTWQYRTADVEGQDVVWAVQSLNDAFVVQLLTSAVGSVTP